MDYHNITLGKITEAVCLLTIDRPKKLNALNKQTLEEIHLAFQELKSDASIRAVIITGAGDRAFVAGADISEFATFSKEQGTALAADGHAKVFDVIANFNKPVIAAINGFALGGGLELAMAAHMRVAAENAKMGLPEVSLGLIPGYGGTQRLPQLIGKGRAMEMVLTGNMVDAKKAVEFGLVNAVVSPQELLKACVELANKTIKNAPNSMEMAIRAVNAGFDSSKNGLTEEIQLFGACFGTADFIEGTSAFLEKRKPMF